MHKEYITMDDPEYFEKVVTKNGTGYRTKKYPGPIAIDAKVALGRHDFPTSNISTEWGGTATCMTSDRRNVNMADELNRLEKELLHE